MVKGILFVVDCLRSDAFPEWFLEEHHGSLYKRFMCCFNTPSSLTSMFTGRHLYTTSKFPINDNVRTLFFVKPGGLSIADKLMKVGIKTLFQTDMHRLPGRVSWSSFAVERVPDEADDYFLLWHTFKTHSPHGRFPVAYEGLFDERKEAKAAYLVKVEAAFRTIEAVIQRLQPDVFAVTGDHGEEFWVDGYEGDTHRRMTGHGPFNAPIVSKNTVFVPFFLSGGKRGTSDSYVSYPFLAIKILRWYGVV